MNREIASPKHNDSIGAMPAALDAGQTNYSFHDHNQSLALAEASALSTAQKTVDGLGHFHISDSGAAGGAGASTPGGTAGLGDRAPGGQGAGVPAGHAGMSAGAFDARGAAAPSAGGAGSLEGSAAGRGNASAAAPSAEAGLAGDSSSKAPSRSGGAEMPPATTNAAQGYSGMDTGLTGGDASIDFHHHPDIYAPSSPGVSTDNTNVKAAVSDGTRQPEVQQVISGPQDATRIVMSREAGWDSKPVSGQEYTHANGKVFVDDSVKDKFPKETVNDLMNQLPNSNFPFDVVITDKKHQQPTAANAQSDHIGWYMEPKYNAHLDNPSLILEVGDTSQRTSDGKDPRAAEVLRHEWTHAFEAKQPGFQEIYDGAIQVEPKITGRARAAESEVENFAVHASEEFLSPDKSRFDKFVEQAPVKAKIMADMFNRQIGAGKGDKTAGQQLLEDRVKEARARTAEPFKEIMAPLIADWKGDWLSKEMIQKLPQDPEFCDPEANWTGFQNFMHKAKLKQYAWQCQQAGEGTQTVGSSDTGVAQP